MTYCVGLRTERGVFIATDSVFSSSIPSKHATAAGETTAFGEFQGEVGLGQLRHVSEDGLKISIGDGTVVGFSGDVQIARTLIHAYFAGRRSGQTARGSVHIALMSITPCIEEAEVLFAFYEAEIPCLLLVNTLNQTCRDVEGLVQLGSELTDGQHEWTAKFVAILVQQLEQLGPHPLHINRIFTNLVALLQSYGVHDYLLQHGVGGAFVAAWVTPAGTRWQGDHMYLIHGETPAFEDPMCATMLRDEIHCLISNQTDVIKLLGWPRPGDSHDDAKARGSAVSKTCSETWDNGTFDYVISLNRTKHIVTVVEMCRQQHHELISLHSTHIANRLGIVWTNALIQYANTIALVDEPDLGHMTTWFFPFKAVSAQEQAEREQFGWECFVDWDGEPGLLGITQ